MSRGPGIVQRSLIAALQGEPDRWFTIDELTEIAYPGEAVGHKHSSSVRRALKKLSPLGVRRKSEGRYGEEAASLRDPVQQA